MQASEEPRGVVTVITGGSGFIGTGLARRLMRSAASTDRILLVDTLGRHGPTPALAELSEHPAVELIQVDLTSPEVLEALPQQVDRVYHLAAVVGVEAAEKRPAQVMRVNTLAALNVFEWFVEHASPSARLLFASTSEVYSGGVQLGWLVPVPTPETVPTVFDELHNPRFSYAISKLWGEMYARFLGVLHNRVLATVRYHNVYGPGMGYEHVIPQIISRVVQREQPFRVIAPDATRSFCWIEDAVEATHRVMEAPGLTGGMVVNIGDQKGEVAIGQVYEMIFDSAGWRPRAWRKEPAGAGSVARRCPDISLLKQLTRYEPRTSLAQGLERTVRWYLEDLSRRQAALQQNKDRDGH